jgi:hypothetical protein
MPQLVQDYQRLINQAVVELPGATDAGIRQALFEVFHTFFTETNSWQETITVAVLAGVTEYNLVIAEGGEFVRLLSLVDTNDIGQPAVTDMVGVLTLRDTPNTAATFTATIAKTIGVPVDREGKPEIPEWVVARWGASAECRPALAHDDPEQEAILGQDRRHVLGSPLSQRVRQRQVRRAPRQPSGRQHLELPAWLRYVANVAADGLGRH